MCSIDLDPCEAWSETWRKARKTHECDSCSAVIQTSEKYIAHFSKFEGTCSYEKICAACDLSRVEFADHHGTGKPAPSYFHIILRECISDGDEDSDQKWAPMLAALQKRGMNFQQLKESFEETEE